VIDAFRRVTTKASKTPLKVSAEGLSSPDQTPKAPSNAFRASRTPGVHPSDANDVAMLLRLFTYERVM
jgi:hypothetical protein